MDYRLPYYMAYPMPIQYDDERKTRMDFEYLKSMYPALAKKLLPYVEDECERLAYKGSMIYDEYPDRLQVRLMCSRICKKVQKTEQMAENEEAFVREMVEVMVFYELFYHRCEMRKKRKNFYLS